MNYARNTQLGEIAATRDEEFFKFDRIMRDDDA